MQNGADLLRDMAFLAIDCQSTGATPAHGSLLEIGWGRTKSPSIVAHVGELPEDEELTPVIARITGLTTGDLSRAISRSDAWRALVAACEATPAPTIIHFARFEEAFLRELHRAEAPDADFPLDIVCTHTIATRLFPDLPRRGLRALAGYFGMTVTPARRSADHVAATVFVWQHLVSHLADQHGVHSMAQLREWMDQPCPARAARRRVYPMARARRLAIAQGPGVYRMLRSNGDVLYVGKARSLRRRVNSYFQKQTRVADRTLEMLSQARDISVTETATALEAALLECDEIKRCAPPYNVALADRPARRAAIGPLRDVEIVEQMWTIAAVVSGGTDGAAPGSETLFDAIDGFEAVDAAQLAEGVGLFREHVGTHTGDVMAWGARLWSERKAAGETDDHGGEDRDEPPEQKVCEALCSIVCRGARAVRSARWMSRLGESSVAWTIGTRARMLVFERGTITRRDDIAAAPVPPGYRRTMAKRWRDFDLATYDRVRVLSTELRRLVVEADDVCVRLGPSKALNRDRLARVLWWV